MKPRYTKLRSSFEDTLEETLRSQGVPFGYETEAFPYVKYHKYTPDFVFYDTRILVEAKGFFTGADRSKVLLAREAIEQEGWELRFVFQKPFNKLSKTSKTTYAAWCERHGFVWADTVIPKEWYLG